MKFRDWHDNQLDLPAGRTFSWRPSAYALTLDQGQVLCIKAAQHNQWELPGGGVELGETPATALQREVLEETGYQIDVQDETPIFMKNDFFYARDIDQYFQSLFMVFRAKLIARTPHDIIVDPHEVAAVRWIGLDRLDQFKFHPYILPLLQQQTNRS